MYSKAPTLAWFLVALTCFLAGAFMSEARQQIAPPPAMPTIDVAVAVELMVEPTPLPTPTPTATPWNNGPNRN